jgi:hypothetical protein
MGKHAFLSVEWLDCLIELNAEYRDRVPPPMVKMRLNQVVTGVPFGGGEVTMFTDTTSGRAIIGNGHVEDPEVVMTTDYATARSLVVDGDPAVAMQAFMSGKIKVEGDMTKILVPPAPKNEAQIEMENRIKEMTE